MIPATQFFQETNSHFEKAAAAYISGLTDPEIERLCGGCGKAMYFEDVALLAGGGAVCAPCHGRLEGAAPHA